MLVLATVWLLLTLYVPTPPDPVPKDSMIVSSEMPEPVMVCPTTSVPEATTVTVKTVPEIEPVTEAVVEFV